MPLDNHTTSVIWSAVKGIFMKEIIWINACIIVIVREFGSKVKTVFYKWINIKSSILLKKCQIQHSKSITCSVKSLLFFHYSCYKLRSTVGLEADRVSIVLNTIGIVAEWWIIAINTVAIVAEQVTILFNTVYIF